MPTGNRLPTTGTSTGASATPTSATASPAGASPSPSEQPTPAPSTPTITSPAATSAAAATSAPGGRPNPDGRNLALRRPATASSEEGGHFAAPAAVDGDLDTRWSSGFSDPQWIRIDLGQVWRLSRVTLVWERSHATAYRVETSTDGRTWTTRYSTDAGTGGTVTMELPGTDARYLRMYGTRRHTEYGYSLLEIEVR